LKSLNYSYIVCVRYIESEWYDDSIERIRILNWNRGFIKNRRNLQKKGKSYSAEGKASILKAISAGGNMDLIPIPYFGMIMALFVAPVLTFGFIVLLRRTRADVEKLKYKKEILELEIKKEEMKLKMICEENKKYDKLLEASIDISSKG
jgi:hypothetical protein